MSSVSRRLASLHSEIAHIRRIVAQTDWDQRPTFCYRLRAALREAMSQADRNADIDQRLRAVMRAAELFVNTMRPNFTPAATELLARIEEFENALSIQTDDRVAA